MSISSDMPRDNLTLSEADLAVCRPIVGDGLLTLMATYCALLPRAIPGAKSLQGATRVDMGGPALYHTVRPQPWGCACVLETSTAAHDARPVGSQPHAVAWMGMTAHRGGAVMVGSRPDNWWARAWLRLLGV